MHRSKSAFGFLSVEFENMSAFGMLFFCCQSLVNLNKWIQCSKIIVTRTRTRAHTMLHIAFCWHPER